jgi:hypothetical protein
MTDAHRLALVRGIHTAIYVVMAAAVFVVLYAGVTGAQGNWLWIAVGLVAIEVAVFAASGMKCPLTAMAARYGSASGGVSDTYLPERLTRHTFAFFTPLIVVGLALVAARWLGLLQ